MTKSKDLPGALSAKKAAEFAGLFLWICPAEEILHESDLPMPYRGKFNYLDVLIQQCKLRKESVIPVFFGYMGSMLTSQQKFRMEGLNDSVPNLITVDLDSKEFQSVITPGDDVASALNKKVLFARDQFRARKGQAELVRHRSSYISDALGSIQYLVDYARIFCVTCSDILLKYAEQKFPEEGHKTPFIENFRRQSCAIAYSDFDAPAVDLSADIFMLDGLATDTNRLQLIAQKTKAIERMFEQSPELSAKFKGGSEKMIADMTEYYRETFGNREKFAEMCQIFPDIDSDLYRKLELEEEFLRVSQNDALPQISEIKHRFVLNRDSSDYKGMVEEMFLLVGGYSVAKNMVFDSVMLENSVIIVNSARNKRLVKAFNDLRSKDHVVSARGVEVPMTPLQISQEAFNMDIARLRPQKIDKFFYGRVAQMILGVEKAHDTSSSQEIGGDRTYDSSIEDLYGEKSPFAIIHVGKDSEELYHPATVSDEKSPIRRELDGVIAAIKAEKGIERRPDTVVATEGGGAAADPLVGTSRVIKR